MGIEQHHPDAEPPTAPQATGGSDLPRLMEQLTRALLHAPADSAVQAERAGLSAPTAPPAESPAEVEAVAPVDAPAPVTPPAPRRPGAVLGELAFLDE